MRAVVLVGYPQVPLAGGFRREVVDNRRGLSGLQQELRVIDRLSLHLVGLGSKETYTPEILLAVVLETDGNILRLVHSPRRVHFHGGHLKFVNRMPHMGHVSIFVDVHLKVADFVVEVGFPYLTVREAADRNHLVRSRAK